MSSWYTLAVNASVVIIRFQLQRGQLLKTSLLENCRLSQKQESIRSHWTAVSKSFRLSESCLKEKLRTLVSLVQIPSASRCGLDKLNQTFCATVLGGNTNKRF